jgi:hypothetical protein
MMKIKVLILGFLLPLFACEENVVTVNEGAGINAESLIGSWIHPQYNDSTITYEKSGKLSDQEYGFSFLPENKFLERKNIGWCGTPPVSYGDYEGTWTRNDSILDISVGYWGGTEDFKWKIMSMDQHHLTLFTLAVEYHPESK